MKGFLLVLILLGVFIFSAQPVHAGISLGEGAITLSAGQTKEVCDVWIYATQGGGTYHVSTTGELEPLTTEITPNEFTLEPIDCPAETDARRVCITQTCLSGDQSSCKIVCVKFTAPMLIEWNPEKVKYTGSILDTIKMGVATIKEPYEFSVYVEPMDMKPLVGTVVAVIIIVMVLAFLFLKKRKK